MRRILTPGALVSLSIKYLSHRVAVVRDKR
jgi:hypothetical protein